MEGITISDPIIEKFDVVKNFPEKTTLNQQLFNSLSFSDSGKFLAAGSDDETIYLYDIENGNEVKTIPSKKYGVDKITFTHDEHTVLCASNNEHDHTIRHLDLKTNSYIRYFKGHSSTVTSLKVSPTGNTFCSCSDDGEVRFWDLTSGSCITKLKIPNDFLNKQNKKLVRCCFDEKGLVVAIGCAPNIVSLYDFQKLSAGPFATWSLGEINKHITLANNLNTGNKNFDTPNNDPNFFEDFLDLELQPGPVGNLLSVVTTKGFYFYNSYHDISDSNGQLYSTFIPFYNTHECIGSFSPDGKYYSVGSADGSILTYNLITKQQVFKSKSQHSNPVRIVKWNPNYLLFCSSCTRLALWIPNTT